MDAKSHSLHFLLLKCMLKPSARVNAWSHELQLFYFSPLCVLKCCLKWFELHEVLSQMLHYYTLKRFLSGMWRCGILCALAKHCQIFTTPNVLSQNIVIYLPHQIQLKCVETVFLLNVAWCIFKCALRFPTNDDAKPHWLH